MQEALRLGLCDLADPVVLEIPVVRTDRVKFVVGLTGKITTQVHRILEQGHVTCNRESHAPFKKSFPSATWPWDEWRT